MILQVQLPVLGSIDGPTARVALITAAVVKLVEFSLVLGSIVVITEDCCTIKRTARELLFSVLCNEMSAHAGLSAVCFVALWVRA